MTLIFHLDWFVSLKSTVCQFLTARAICSFHYFLIFFPYACIVVGVCLCTNRRAQHRHKKQTTRTNLYSKLRSDIHKFVSLIDSSFLSFNINEYQTNVVNFVECVFHSSSFLLLARMHVAMIMPRRNFHI